MPWLQRTEMLIGKDSVEILKKSSIAIFGIGGVGSFAAEAAARCGIGKLFLCDNDTVDETNINRQLIAMHSTIGRYKTEVMAERIHDINPEAEVVQSREFFSEENADSFDLERFDYIIDAIDSVKSKLTLIEYAKKNEVPVISSMGTGNKIDPGRFEITDISKTSVCPLARAMRTQLRRRGIKKVKVLYSREEPEHFGTGTTPASISFVPSVAGLMIAGEVVRDLMKNNRKTGVAE